MLQSARAPPCHAALDMTSNSPFPVIVGGIGGSGTRLVAGLLQIFGYYIGDDLNDSLDNHWFTLLFKRRSILLENDVQFHRLFSCSYRACRERRG